MRLKKLGEGEGLVLYCRGGLAFHKGNMEKSLNALVDMKNFQVAT